MFKKADFRMVLTALEKGAILKEHHADGTISVQVLKGSIRFAAQDEAHTLLVNSVLMQGFGSASYLPRLVLLQSEHFLRKVELRKIF